MAKPNPFDQFDPPPIPTLVNAYAQPNPPPRAPAPLSMIPSGLQVTAPAPAKEPNPFDQFDEPTPAPPQAAASMPGVSADNPFRQFHQQAGTAKEPNPFDQFDTPAPTAPGAPAGANPFDQFDVPAAPAKPQMDAAGDIGGGIVSGLVNAVTGLAGMPGTLQQLEGNLAGRGLDAMGFPGAAETVRNGAFLPTGETLTGLAAKVMGPLYRKPETVPGQYAQSIAENAPGALAGPGGVARKLIEMIVPGVAAETAARVAPAGYEGAARLAGGLAGNVGTAAGAARMNAGDRAVVAATRGVEPDALRAGQPVLNTGRGIGVDLSGPEGVQFATNNGTKLGDLQRVVEGSVAGGPTMAQFYANRPQQMRTAAENAFDTIAPQADVPTTLGPRVSDAAQGAIMASPEGQALQEAIWRVGPRETAGSAGPTIQNGLADTYARREGMRNALGDQDYAAARAAEPQIDVSSLEPRTFQADPRTSYRYAGDEGGYAPVERQPGTPRIETLSSPDASGLIQADPRNVAGFIDGELQNAKGATAAALGNVRGMLATDGGLDTTVAGLGNVRSQVGTMLTAAVRDGDRPTAAALRRVQQQLDQSLELVPEHADATRNFAAASVPLQPFENPALAKAIQSDDLGRTLSFPPERVAPTIEAAGPSTVRTFNSVAPPEARAGFENYLGTKIMDGATDGRGRLSGDQLALGTRNASDILDAVPGLRERIMGVQAADTALTPQRRSIVGQIANDGDGRGTLTGTQATADRILPAKPLTGGQGELADATARIGAIDPEGIAQLVRQRMADQYEHSATALVGGEAQGGGAKFAKDMAGGRTSQKQANIDAVLGALPNSPDAPQSVSTLLDTLRATGMRRPPGSNTAMDRAMLGNLAEQGAFGELVTALRTQGRSLLYDAGSAAKRVALGRAMGRLADLFVHPNSANLIADIAERGVEPVLANAMLRQALQSPGAVSH
jgi:hypothetical protein